MSDLSGIAILGDHRQERAEVEAILASEMFKRAPTLCQILSYVCQQYFAGEAARIKEYNIAVEALGRDPKFDPNADTIVRVEASRLRKRLGQYYATEGAGHLMQLHLAKGGYVPQFLSRQALEEPGIAPDASAFVPPAEGTSPDHPEPSSGETTPSGGRDSRRFALRILVVATGIVALSAAVLFVFFTSRSHKPNPAARGVASDSSTSPSFWGELEEAKEGLRGPATDSSASPRTVLPPKPALPAGKEIRIVAGFMRPEFIDSLGQMWSGDQYFTGGMVSESPGSEIQGVLDSVLYRTARRGDFHYDIPLAPGVYELRLLFAETRYGKGNRVYQGEASRVFHISVNGVRRLSDLDLLADVGGPDMPADRVFRDISPARDGYLHLAFTPVTGAAVLNGIEILPGIPGKMRPVRIVAGGRSYYDRAGRPWGGDRCFIGGRPVTKPIMVRDTSDPELYVNERWGHFTYSIPVADGRYKVTLKFAETNFGPRYSGRTGVGMRVFDVYCNGVALLRDFDIFKEAGSEDKALDKVFHGLKPNAQGRLVFSFVPVKQYATVRAIEVVDEGP